MKHFLAVMLVISFLLTTLTGCFGQKPPEEKALTYDLPGVTREMQSAAYWTEKLKDGDKVLLTADEITQINTQISSTAANYTTNLVSYPSSLTVSQITGMLKELEFTETALFTSEGVPFEEGFLESLAASVNEELLETTTKVSYGLMLKNDELRSQPTATKAFTSAEDRTVDLFQRGLLSIGEPVIVIFTNSEQNWYFVKTANDFGWVNAESVIFFTEKGSWVNYIDSPDFLMVTGPEVTLEYNPYQPTISGLTLRMGTKLPLYDLSELGSSTTVDGQGIANGYVVKLPMRNSLGFLEFVPYLIPESADVCIGYLPYTSENVLEQSFKLLGRRYCENGIYGGRDNESTVCDIFKTFGFVLPVTTKLQAAIAANDTDVSDMVTEDTLKAFEKLPAGTLLFTKDEALIYVGVEEEVHYAIHPAKSFYFDDKRYDANTTVLSTLNIVKKDGTEYIDAVETIKKFAVTKSSEK